MGPGPARPAHGSRSASGWTPGRRLGVYLGTCSSLPFAACFFTVLGGRGRGGLLGDRGRLGEQRQMVYARLEDTSPWWEPETAADEGSANQEAEHPPSWLLLHLLLLGPSSPQP